MAQPLLGNTGSTAAIVNSLNNTTREVNRLQTVQVFKDSSGKRRIIFGKLPDGTYGLAISKEGYDVVEVLQ